VLMYHDCVADENHDNDSLIRATVASGRIPRVAIEIAASSVGRNPPNACYAIDSLCRAQNWTSTIVTGTDMDELSELAEYDVVVSGDIGTIRGENDFSVYDDALLQWVRQGGGFVGLGWMVYGVYYGPGPWSPMDTVCAVRARDQYGWVESGYVHVLNPDHPITQGVADFPVYDIGEFALFDIWPGATFLGDYTAMPGNASITYKWLESGRSVYLGPIYFGNFSAYDNEPYFSDTNSMRLLKQAIEWAAFGERPGIADDVLGHDVRRPVVATMLRQVIEFRGTEPAVLIDVAGREVLGLVPGANDIRAMSPGVYFLVQAGSRETTKLVIQQ